MGIKDVRSLADGAAERLFMADSGLRWECLPPSPAATALCLRSAISGPSRTCGPGIVSSGLWSLRSPGFAKPHTASEKKVQYQAGLAQTRCRTIQSANSFRFL